jgi:hypothetical protein
MTKKPQYKLIDIGHPSDPPETRYKKLIAQIPKGKTILLIDENIATTCANKILVRVMNPKIYHQTPKKNEKKE